MPALSQHLSHFPWLCTEFPVMEGRLTEVQSAFSGPAGRIIKIVGLAVSVIIASFLVGVDRNGLLWEAPDRLTYDWRTYLFSARAPAPRDDIVLIRVDED